MSKKGHTTDSSSWIHLQWSKILKRKQDLDKFTMQKKHYLMTRWLSISINLLDKNSKLKKNFLNEFTIFLAAKTQKSNM